jgi:hypothetical protein
MYCKAIGILPFDTFWRGLIKKTTCENFTNTLCNKLTPGGGKLPLVESDGHVPVARLATKLSHDEAAGPDPRRLEPPMYKIDKLSSWPRTDYTILKNTYAKNWRVKLAGFIQNYIFLKPNSDRNISFKKNAQFF